jgi:hypothetical protein
MEESGGAFEHVIDLRWQAAAGKWKAMLVNRATGERHEVSSARELQEALEGFLAANVSC